VYRKLKESRPYLIGLTRNNGQSTVFLQDLPEFWNTYRIGADLMQDELKKKAEAGELEPSLLGFMDGGFDLNHPLLKDRLIFTLQKPDVKADDVEHGTHVLGTAACDGPFSVGKNCPIQFTVASYEPICNQNADASPITYQASLIKNLTE